MEYEPVDVEAGVEWSVSPTEFSLASRLLARQVECIHVAAGAEAHELLALARALSHDRTPIPSTPMVRVDLVPQLAASGQVTAAAGVESGFQMSAPSPQPRRSERRHWDERRAGRRRWTGVERRATADRRATGERRSELIEEQHAAVSQLFTTLARHIPAHAWESALFDTLALVRLAPRVPSGERQAFVGRVRKAVSRRAIVGFIDTGERDPVARDAVTTVLHFIGLEAAQAVMDRLRQGDAIGVRSYYYDVIGGMPETYALVTPLLVGREAHEVRHGIALLGRLGLAEGVTELEPLLEHRDERIRTAAVRALGEIHQGPATEPLRRALHSPDSRTRAAAADAIAVWRGGALASLLVAALDSEHDREVWHAGISALGRIGSDESSSALANVALTPRKVFRRKGYNAWQRLAAVTALGLSGSPTSKATLEQLSHTATGVVAYTARRVLQAHGRPLT